MTSVLKVDKLRKDFGGLVAVREVSFEVKEGEFIGLIGPNGCGKSTTAKMVLMLEEPTDGEIIFEGENALKMNRSSRKEYQSSVQAVFQDPWASLNPRMRVEGIVGEPMEVNTSMTKGEIRTKVGNLLEEVGLQPYQAKLYPHEF